MAFSNLKVDQFGFKNCKVEQRSHAIVFQLQYKNADGVDLSCLEFDLSLAIKIVSSTLMSLPLPRKAVVYDLWNLIFEFKSFSPRKENHCQCSRSTWFHCWVDAGTLRRNSVTPPNVLGTSGDSETLHPLKLLVKLHNTRASRSSTLEMKVLYRLSNLYIEYSKFVYFL